MMDDRDHNKVADAAPGPTPPVKRAYQSPLLTEYGSVEDLVDAGVVGNVATVPSLTPKSG